MATADTGRAASAVASRLATAPPAGGWCVFLGKRPGTPLAAADVARIVAHVRGSLWGDPLTWLYGPLLLIYDQMVNETLGAIETALTRLVSAGATCDQIPNDLGTIPEVDAVHKKRTDPVAQGLTFIFEWAPLGDILIKAGVLIGIIVLLLMAIGRVLR